MIEHAVRGRPPYNLAGRRFGRLTALLTSGQVSVSGNRIGWMMVLYQFMGKRRKQQITHTVTKWKALRKPGGQFRKREAC